MGPAVRGDGMLLHGAAREDGTPCSLLARSRCPTCDAAWTHGIFPWTSRSHQQAVRLVLPQEWMAC